MKNHVCVLGAGASGLVAAIVAARRGKKVTLIEKANKIGKKIYATGNGKCNYTNTLYEYDSYRGEDLSIVDSVLSRFSYVDTIDFFEELGILAKNRNGYIYPYSEQASSVVEVLMMELEKLRVDIRLEERVIDIKRCKDTAKKEAWQVKEQTVNKSVGYEIITDKKKYRCEAVIVSMGGKASPKLGSDGSGLVLLEKLGHKIIKPHKALVQLKCNAKSLKSISGVRLGAKIKMNIDGKDEVYTNEGEIIFTDYGISGIPIMQLSRYASKALSQKKKVTLSLDFFPDIDYASLMTMIKDRKNRNRNKKDEEILIGMLNRKLASYIMKNIKSDKELVNNIKGMKLEVVDTNSWDNAQVMAGGVSTKEIKHKTMESTIHNGMYITGEIMDIDGTCGGYNLQWAWATGYIAGMNV